jgi:hypothetical protein
MDLYHLTLYVHLLALIVAAGATAVMKLAMSRRARARTVGELLDWHNVMLGTSKLFPMVLAVFVLTGSSMLSMTTLHVWSTGFVVAGLVGVAFLLVSGIFLGTKGKAMKGMLEEMVRQHGADHPAPKMVPPPVLSALPMINTFVALAVAFDMVTKPTSIPMSLAIVAIGAVLGLVVALKPRARVAAETASAA